MKKVPMRLAAAGVGVAMLATTAGGAMAKAPTGEYANFTQCPVSNPSVQSCVYSKTTSGTFKLPNLSVPITNPIIFQVGYSSDPDGTNEKTYPAANGVTLSNSPQNVPGGLSGLTPPNLFPQPLQNIIFGAINTANNVTATAQLVGPAKFSFDNFLAGSGPTVTLPIRFKLDNPFLGSNCYIGSAASPITLNLTDGTTTPPPGTAPIKGSPGTLDFRDGGNHIVTNGDSLVDNAFSVPGASGCGGAFSGLVDPVVDLKAGIPAAAGKSSAVLNGTAELGDADKVRASEK